jgi:vanillate/3-O-methylgallate O-demethylase
MTYRNLEQKLQETGSAVKLARGSPLALSLISEVPMEFSNWRDEQKAWLEAVALLDLTHHMTDLCIEGPDAIRLLSDLGVNSFAKFRVDQAKQFVCCNFDGYMIGDGILFFLEDNKVSLLGLPAAHNWVQYHAESGRYDVSVTRDDPTAINPTGMRRLYRFQLQGPGALSVLRAVADSPPPEITFFRMGKLTIAGAPVRALRHGMAGAPGLELFGSWDERDAVREAILRAGERFGLRQVGAMAYPTTTLESGWIPAPVPAIFTDEALRPYREWLPADSHEATSSLGGSYYSDDITDYYVTPYEFGYGSFVKFDHEFIGRAALQTMTDKPRRRKVTLVWKSADVMAAMGTVFERGDAAKYIALPWSQYSLWHHDKVLRDGRVIGLSRCCGCSYNERAMLSLAVIDSDVPIGSEVTLIWGEESDGARRAPVERHALTEIRAIVSPCPISEITRSSYAQGWRSNRELR